VQLRNLVVDGTELAFREWEGPDDAPVVLLHSLGEDSTTWTRVAVSLSQSHVVYAFDLRGHGASEHTPQYSLELMRDDIQGAIDYLENLPTEGPEALADRTDSPSFGQTTLASAE